MLELSASQVDKGVFELTLEKDPPVFLRWVYQVGPIRARLIALIMIVFAGLLNFSNQLANFFLENAYAANSLEALRYQSYFKWAIVAVAMYIWLSAFITRKEKVFLTFNRPQNLFTYKKLPRWSLGLVEEGSGSFEKIKKIEVFAPSREPQTPYGYLRIAFDDELLKKEQSFEFRLLSDDQFKIYPTNLGKITGKDPVGDWVDPDQT